MIIVVLWHEVVKLYEKASFVHYSTEILCTSLRFSNDYNYSFLIDPARRTAEDIIRIRSSELINNFQMSVPHCFQNITHLLDNFQFWCSSHEFFYILNTHIITVLQTQ